MKSFCSEQTNKGAFNCAGVHADVCELDADSMCDSLPVFVVVCVCWYIHVCCLFLLSLH